MNHLFWEIAEIFYILPSYVAKNPVCGRECSDVLYIKSIREPVETIGSVGICAPHRRTEMLTIGINCKCWNILQFLLFNNKFDILWKV